MFIQNIKFKILGATFSGLVSSLDKNEYPEYIVSIFLNLIILINNIYINKTKNLFIKTFFFEKRSNKC